MEKFLWYRVSDMQDEKRMFHNKVTILNTTELYTQK